MSSDEIKSGPQVVSEFLDSLQHNNAVDAATLTAITELVEGEKLTKTRLHNALQKEREEVLDHIPELTTEENGGGDD